MPSWLILFLTIEGFILVAALQAAACTGRLRTIWEAYKGISLFLLALAAPAIVVGLFVLIFYP